jgi:hypothetical protein
MIKSHCGGICVSSYRRIIFSGKAKFINIQELYRTLLDLATICRLLSTLGPRIGTTERTYASPNKQADRR